MSEPKQFEFTPWGVVEAGTKLPFSGDTLNAAGAALEATTQTLVVEPAITSKPFISAFQVMPPQGGISPKDVIRAAKTRVKEIRQEITRLRKLQRELAQLENLLSAAKKPRHMAEVRQLASRK